MRVLRSCCERERSGNLLKGAARKFEAAEVRVGMKDLEYHANPL